MNKNIDTVIIGCGPCGIGAALALKEAGANFVLLESGAPGGKVNIAPRVDNYPGFTKIPGPELAFALYQRVMDAGIELTPCEVLSLTKEGNLYTVETDNDTYIAKTVLVASGTKERKVGLAKEDEFLGHGISYCAICDGHFFVGQDVAVCGGGNSALKETIYLANKCHHVYLFHRRNEFRGNDKLVNELKELPNVTILTPYIPVEILGETKVEGLKIQNRETNEIITLDVQGFFPLVGQIPNTQFVKIPGVLNEWNCIPVDRSMQTSSSGLFAGGDVLPRELKQIYLSQHDGMVAAKSIIEYLKK